MAEEDDAIEQRDEEIDAYLRETEDALALVFGRFISGVSDDPRDIAWDVLFLALMDDGMRRVVDRMPWGSRARAAARVAVDVRDEPTRGLEHAREVLLSELESRLRTLVQERLVTVASRMVLEQKTSGFRLALQAAAEKFLAEVLDVFSNTLLTWERVVLERIAPDNAVYLYAGPVDKKNRPFCAAIAPQKVARTRDAIEELNNHPLLHWYVPPNVFTFAGGINCRHLWVPMSRVTASARGLSIVEAGEDG